MKEDNINFDCVGKFEETKITHIQNTIENIQNEKQLVFEIDSLLLFYKKNE